MVQPMGDVESAVFRPVRELKGFVLLQPGNQTVSFTLDQRAFAYWNTQLNGWHVETGAFSIEIGHSSADIALAAQVWVEGSPAPERPFTMDSIFMDLMKSEKARAVLAPLLAGMRESFGAGGEEGRSQAAESAISDAMLQAMLSILLAGRSQLRGPGELSSWRGWWNGTKGSQGLRPLDPHQSYGPGPILRVKHKPRGRDRCPAISPLPTACASTPGWPGTALEHPGLV